MLLKTICFGSLVSVGRGGLGWVIPVEAYLEQVKVAFLLDRIGTTLRLCIANLRTIVRANKVIELFLKEVVRFVRLP